MFIFIAIVSGGIAVASLVRMYHLRKSGALVQNTVDEYTSILENAGISVSKEKIFKLRGRGTLITEFLVCKGPNINLYRSEYEALISAEKEKIQNTKKKSRAVGRVVFGSVFSWLFSCGSKGCEKDKFLYQWVIEEVDRAKKRKHYCEENY